MKNLILLNFSAVAKTMTEKFSFFRTLNFNFSRLNSILNNFNFTSLCIVKIRIVPNYLKMNVEYKIGFIPKIKDIIEVYRSAGLKRPINDFDRIEKMYQNSNLIISAWSDGKLVGISRSITDFHYCCYLSDLAVKLDYQKHGIGKELIRLTKEKIGDQTMLLLLSAPNAMDYYPKVGFEKVENGFMIKRKI